MFAILIAEENLQKIHTIQYPGHSPDELNMRLYTEHHNSWYFVHGYVDNRGRYTDWAILPEYILVDNFEFDKDKAQTDWDQIVRK